MDGSAGPPSQKILIRVIFNQDPKAGGGSHGSTLRCNLGHVYRRFPYGRLGAWARLRWRFSGGDIRVGSLLIAARAGHVALEGS